MKTGKYTHFENQTVSLSFGTNYLNVTTIYTPSGIFSSEFHEQISDLLSKLLSLTGKHVILGDFNFQINDPTDTHAAKFKALTEQFNLIQHVSIPTHDAGNKLDLFLIRDDLSVSSIFTDHSVKSDHSAVPFTISYASPVYKPSKLTVDKLQLQEQRNKYNALLNSTKKGYIKNKIENLKTFLNYAISF